MDAFQLLSSDKAGAYRAFVDHLLYATEQMLVVEKGWDITLIEQLETHAAYLCSSGAPISETAQIAGLLAQYRSEVCSADTGCV